MALKVLTKSIALDSLQAWNFNERGGSFLNLKKYKEAYNDFKKASELDPKEDGYKINLQKAEKLLKE